MAERIDSIVIVGGGTSGWLSAAYLAKSLGTYRPDGVSITLIEASDIPPIGVGEGTFPSLRTTMAHIGVDEAEFMRESHCTLKQGIKFIDWENTPLNGRHEHYYHLFNFPKTMGGGIDLSPYWVLGCAEEQAAFASAVSPQSELCDHSRAPKRLTDPPYIGPMNYAYHFDAGKLAEFLKVKAKKLGVKHVIGKVDRVDVKDDGAIASVNVDGVGTIKAGLFIDCSGLYGLMISKTLGAKNRDVSDTLFVDRALAVQVPDNGAVGPIESTTLSTAHEAGWTWDIGLHDRRGVGYVYSSQHSTDERAEEVLQNYIGEKGADLPIKRLKMPTGFCETPWLKNCIAIGLSGGFLEPLEATGIAMIEAAVRLVADYFPRDGKMENVSQVFNRAMVSRYENAVEFIKMHYFLTKRTDHDFWIDNARVETAPQSLLDKLERWKTRVPNLGDFSSSYHMFGLESYQYVFFGMGCRPDLSHNVSSFPYMDQAKNTFADIARAKKRAVEALPEHRQFIRDVYKSGYRVS